ncbi:MAG: Gfo/Idh/MocA family oxidoreductase [Candidatus Omnitrophica bacterium]|nr:Gfo/Idh/MocA family oxidoreductase [Candidatus Omnitrophota bacterium]
MFRIAVIGCGYWGPKLVRNFGEQDDVKVEYVSDLHKERLNFIKKRHPVVKTTRNYKDILRDNKVDALAIATPVSTHFQLAQEALKHKKHVLLEKPMTCTQDQAQRLIDLAKKHKRVLMVGHTFLYTGAVRKIKEIMDSGQLGKLYYFDSVRINLGMFQHDTNVIWDLAAHDFSIMDYLLGVKPVNISASGACHARNEIENIAYVTVNFTNNVIAHFYVNWLAPVKIRQILIGGSDKMILFDDMLPSEKVKVYDKGVWFKEGSKKDDYKIQVQYRKGDMYVPQIDITEGLYVECKHFIDCIKNDKKPLSDAAQGLRVVRLLEAAEKSIKNNAKYVKL